MIFVGIELLFRTTIVQIIIIAKVHQTLNFYRSSGPDLADIVLTPFSVVFLLAIHRDQKLFVVACSLHSLK